MANKRRSPLRFIFTLLLLLIVVAAAYGFMLYSSVSKLRTSANSATEAYQSCITQINNSEYEDALVSIRTVASDVKTINTELQGWQWNIAAKLPYIDTDVSCARQSANVADTLTNEALMPVIEEAGDVMAGVSSSNSLEATPDAFSKIPHLYETVTSARAIVATCKTDADALPTSHFDELNNMTAMVKEATSNTETTFAAFDSLFEAVDGLSALGDMLTTTTDTGTTTTDTGTTTTDTADTGNTLTTTTTETV